MSEHEVSVRELIEKYTVEELNDTAEEYYKNISLEQLSRKPFRFSEIKHLFPEVGHLYYGLDALAGDTILDFGCGSGWSSRFLAACGCNVIGVDVSQTALAYARDLAAKWTAAGLTHDGLVEFRQFDGRTLPVDSASIDKVFILDAFHHVPDQAATLREIARVLKPGGVAGFCEPGPNHSRHPLSQREMRLYKVIENDIVLDVIRPNAEAVGLVDLRVCLSPLLPMVVPFDEYKSFPTVEGLRSRFIDATDWRVKNYPIFFLTKVGERIKDSRGIDGLSGKLELLSGEPIRCSPGSPGRLRMSATNDGDALWLPSGVVLGAVDFGYEIRDASGGSKLYFSNISLIGVRPGETVEFDVELPVLKAGEYRIRMDILSFNVAWFNTSVGSELTFDLLCK